MEYALANKIADEPTFAWWTKEVLCHCEHIISSIHSCYWKCTHRFGIQLLKLIEDALQIDKEIHTQFWYKKQLKRNVKSFTCFQVLGER